MVVEKAKKIILRFRGYRNPQAYWDLRWKLALKAEEWGIGQLENEFAEINTLMKTYDCHSILDVGCGKAMLKNLKGYVGFDFSQEATKQSKLSNYYIGNIADPTCPLPSKSFDAILSRFCLLHIPFKQINYATQNMMQIAKKLIILREPQAPIPKQTHFHCYTHNLGELFKPFKGKLWFLGSNPYGL